MKSRLVGAALVSGALALGGAGAAYGATPGGGAGGSSPGASVPAGAGGRCTTLAPRVLDRLERFDRRITAVLPKLQSAEQRAGTAGHTRAADRIGARITRLERRQKKIEARMATIEQHCPGVTPSAA